MLCEGFVLREHSGQNEKQSTGAEKQLKIQTKEGVIPICYKSSWRGCRGDLLTRRSPLQKAPTLSEDGDDVAQKYIMGHRAQARERVVRYIVLTAILLVICATVQVSVLSRFRILGTVPDMMLCVVLLLGYFGGRQLGAICGIAAGVLVEAMGSHGIVLLPLFYLFCGYLTGHYARSLTRGFLLYLPYLGIALPCRAAVTLLYASLTYQSIHLTDLLIQTMLPELLLTAALGCALYYPMRGFYGLLERKGNRT